jgi:hypothetical protein
MNLIADRPDYPTDRPGHMVGPSNRPGAKSDAQQHLKQVLFLAIILHFFCMPSVYLFFVRRIPLWTK